MEPTPYEATAYETKPAAASETISHVGRASAVRRRQRRSEPDVAADRRAPRRPSTPTSSQSPAAPRSAGSMLASGMTQRRNPICAASRTRSAACEMPRTSPASPTSPNTAVVGGIDAVAHARGDGRERRRDRPPARRRVIPPAMFTNTSSPDQVQAGALLEHRQQQRQPLLIDAARHPPRVAVGAGADERLHLDENRPRALRPRTAPPSPARSTGRSARNSCDGLGTGRRPRAGHLEHAELADGAEPVLHGAHDAVRVVPLALEVEHRVDDVLERLRARRGCRPW